MLEEKILKNWTTIYHISLFILAFATVFSIVAGIILQKKSSEKLHKMEIDISVNNKETAKANKEAAEAHEEAAKADETAAKANLRVAELEKENIELRLKLANRRITKEQHAILVKELSKHQATFNMEVMGDPESGLFAKDILKTFEDAGWKVDKKEFPLGVIWHGLILFQTKDPSGLIIVESLKKAKIPFSIGDQWRKRATIMVGGKPPVF